MQSAPRPSVEARTESGPCSKPAGKPHLHDFWSRLCSRTPHHDLHSPGLPRFHAAGRQNDTDARYVMDQNPHGSGYRADCHRRRNIQVVGLWAQPGWALAAILRSACRVISPQKGTGRVSTRWEDGCMRPGRRDLLSNS